MFAQNAITSSKIKQTLFYFEQLVCFTLNKFVLFTLNKFVLFPLIFMC